MIRRCLTTIRRFDLRSDRSVSVLKIGWFSTGRGEGSRGLLDFVCRAIEDGNLAASIDFVFSNREPGEAEGSDQFFRLVHEHGFPLVTLSSSRYRREHGGGRMDQHRMGFDREAMRLLAGYQPDVCVLAGYMLIFGAEMCRRYPLINLHGALPDGPTGPWQSVIWQLIETKAERTGSMIHLATEDVDRGPVLSHCALPLRGGVFDAAWETVAGRSAEEVRADEGEDNALFRCIRTEGYRREPRLLLATLRAVGDGRLCVRPGEALDSTGEPLGAVYPQGLPLTEEIEAALAGESAGLG